MPSIRNPYFPAIANKWQQTQNFNLVNGNQNFGTWYAGSNDGQGTNVIWQIQNALGYTIRVYDDGTVLIGRYTDGYKYIQVGQLPSAITPTIASATIYQNTTNSYQTIDIPCYASTAGTAGTVAVAYGSSSTPSTIYTQYVSGSTSSTAQAVIQLRVPPQWYYELTATGVTLGTATMVQE